MPPVAELAPAAEPRELTGVVNTNWNVSVFLAGQWRPGLALAWYHDDEGWRFLLDADLDCERIRSWYRFHPDVVRAVMPRSRRRALASRASQHVPRACVSESAHRSMCRAAEPPRRGEVAAS